MLSVSLKKNLGSFALDVNFETEKGLLGLLGASGCGKSMTLKCIAGIEKPDRGRIVLDDRVLFDSEKGVNLPPQKRRVGYLFQQYALFPHMTVWQNIATGCRSKERRAAATAEKIRALRLEGLEKKHPAQLSGGQQQRVALARILVSEPACLLLDEPFSALDSYLKENVELELADTLAAFAGATVFVSHNRDEIYRLCQRVCVLERGRSEPMCSVQALFERPETLSACRLSGCSNFSRVRNLGDGRVQAEDWGAALRVPACLPGTTWLGVHARRFALSREQQGENSFCLKVSRVVEDVFSTLVLFDTGYGSRIRVELDKAEWAPLANESHLWLTAAPEDILLLRD